MQLHDQIHLFRHASRSVYNNYFLPVNDRAAGVSSLEGKFIGGDVTPEERFVAVERALFDSLVTEVCNLPHWFYGDADSSPIEVHGKQGGPLRTMIQRNADPNRGIWYWDDPTKEVSALTKLKFISFFDFDSMAYWDFHYVRCVITDCPEDHSLNGSHALINCHEVRFVRAAE